MNVGSNKIETFVGRHIGNNEFERLVNGYKLTRTLGSGAFGVVSLGEKNNQQFAIKVYNLAKLKNASYYDKLMQLIETEVAAMKQLNHPNIMQIFDHFKTKNNIYLVLKLYKDGDMLDYIQKNGFLTEQKVMQLLPQVVSALKFAADRRIMHRDIKLENLFMDGNQIVVGDFGLAKILDERVTYTVLGTKPFMAPEFQFKEGYSFGADIWALGVNIYMSMYGTDPWGNSEYRREAKSGKYKLYPKVNPTTLSRFNCGSRLPFRDKQIISNHLQKILQLMIEYDPDTRITWKSLSEMLSNNQPIFNSPQPAPLFEKENRIKLEPIGESEDKNVMGSEILERHTFQQSVNKITSNDINAACQVIAATKNNPYFLPQAKYFDLLLTQINQFGQGNAQSIFAPLLQSAANPKAEEEAVEQYILFYTYICNFFLQVCQLVYFNAQYQPAYSSIKGVMFFLVNYVSKKTIRIATYFIQKLDQNAGQFSAVGMKYEFYQNGFAKQYLDRFDEVYMAASQFWSLSLEPVNVFLPPKFEDRKLHLERASNCLEFSESEERGFNLSMYYMVLGLEKFNSTFERPQFQDGKKMVVQLSIVCRYKDTLIFKKEQDQFECLANELQIIHDPSTLEAKYQQDKEYFRRWRESTIK
jgi:serine/threonine protein kinase